MYWGETDVIKRSANVFFKKFTLATSIQHDSIEKVRAIRQGKEIKGIQTGKQEVISLCTWNYLYLYLILYIDLVYRNPKECIEKLLGLKNKFHKFAGYKINI